MHRHLIAEIERWDKEKMRKPLILMGARQVGKTWLMNEFASKNYPGNTVSVNFMENELLRSNMETVNLDPHSVLHLIETLTERKVIPGKTLLLMDEIQESPRALTSLKFFNEELPELAIIAAGSLLGLSVNRFNRKEGASRASFPVGKVSFLDVTPMTFIEFLHANGESGKASVIERGEWEMMEALSESFESSVRTYAFVGGMPAAVLKYLENHNFKDVRSVQNDILKAYDEDFAKHSDGFLLRKLRLLWNALPSQLARENKKFIYTALRNGARAREYEEALQWLSDAGMVHLVRRVSSPLMPLKAYEDFGAFKLYAHDVGLLAAMCDIQAKTVLEGNSIFTHFKGALAEEFVLQELKANGINPYYWTSDDSRTEVEFVIQAKDSVLPIEVKAEKNLRAKSLQAFIEKFNPEKALRLSMQKHTCGEKILDYPLYAIPGMLADIDMKNA